MNIVRKTRKSLTLWITVLLLSAAAWNHAIGHGADSDGDGMPDHWENQYGLLDAVDDAQLDADNDGMRNYQEYVARTDPTNPASMFYADIGYLTNGGPLEIIFTTVSGRVYGVEYTEHAQTGTWQVLEENIAGNEQDRSLFHTNDLYRGYYRIRVGFPALFTTPQTLYFGSHPVGGTSETHQVYITNEDGTNHLFMMTELIGEQPGSFSVINPPAMNYDLQPDETVQFGIMFAPSSAGIHHAKLKCHFDNHAQHLYVPLSGAAQYIYHVNAGGSYYTDAAGTYWEEDYPYFNVGNPYETTEPIAGTQRDPLYQDERWDDTNTTEEMKYSFPVDPGTYQVRLHFAEIFDANNTIGSRVFDVLIEDELVLEDFDIVAAAGYLTAHVEAFNVQVEDDSLDIEFLHVIDHPKISAFEIQSGALAASAEQQGWGHISMGGTSEVFAFELANAGTTPLAVTSLTFAISQGAAHDFHVLFDGIEYTGGDQEVTHALSTEIATGETVTVSVWYTPTEEIDNEVWLVFGSDSAPVNIRLTGTGGTGTGHPFLHVVIELPEMMVDYDGDNEETVILDGRESHTHEFGHELREFEWTTNGTVISTNVYDTHSFGLGTHTLTLTIRDDNEPPEELTESAAFSLVSATNVPGMLALYYEGVPGDGEGSPESMIESVPPNADYAERLEGLNVSAQGGRISQTPYTGVVMAVMHGRLAVTNMATYTFQTTGGITNKLFVDDAEYTGPVMLMTGMHDVEARFAVDALSNLPLYVEYAAGAEPTAPIPGTLLSHNELDMPPVINSAPSSGSTLGGNNVEITGMGFFPSDEVIVHWGASDLTGALLQVTSGQIQLVTPPSNGLIHVTVETPNGVSDSFPYLYSSDGPAPVDFTMTNVAAVAAPSQAAWGPDQRLYVASVAGTITALAFDDRYNVTNTQVITTLETNSNNNILGIAFNPFDDPYNPRIYVAHGQLFANGGACFDGFSPYSGAVSILGGTNFETVEQLISGLPVSNHDHGINGLQFDNSGNLLIAIGGNSNAGITNCNMGALPESPLSAAILKAHIRRTNFNGRVCYVESGTAVTNMDQTGGDMVDVVEGVDVEVYAPGFRNPFDLVFTTDGRLYVTDNGPNAGFGGASLSATNSGPDPEDNDTLNLAMQGHYYGHPNRNRGRYDGRQNVYHGNAEASDPGHFSQAMGEFQPSTDGIDEYRADTFNGAMRGELLIQKWNGPTWRIALSTNGRQIASAAQLPVDLNGLDVIHAPGGTIIGVDYTDHAVKVAHPDDISAIDPTAWDFFPWRAPAETNIPFVIGGAHFNPDTNVVISIGGVSAEVTRVSSGRIHGIIPTPADPSSAWKDVTVVNGAYTSGLTRAFRYLLPTGAGTGTWHSLAPMPHALGEVAAGVINGMLYIVGEGHPATVAFDTFSGQWVSDRAARPYVSDHHAAEVIEDRLYLFGGFDGAADKVQIYDPAADTWTLGSNIPWQAGSPASAVIDGRVYLAGGIQNNTTVTFNAVYDPDADTWSMLASMPAGRNHAASATDGERLYIFGGRGPGSGDGNVVAEGFDDVQIYDPDTDTWETSFDPGSTIPPLPQQRGGTGKAVYRNDEFYIMGGETTDQGQGAVAGDVYNRVDVYHPATQTWRLDAPLPTPRHGIFPLLYDDAIYVGGGGTSAGYGVSDVFEKITR